MDWNQTLDVGDNDYEGRFELIETAEGGEWVAVNGICPSCHYRDTFAIKPTRIFPWANKIRWAEVSATRSKMEQVLYWENSALRRKLELLQTELGKESKGRKTADRRYRKTKKEAKILADSFHKVSSQAQNTEEDSERNTKGRKPSFDKKDFLHYR